MLKTRQYLKKYVYISEQYRNLFTKYKREIVNLLDGKTPSVIFLFYYKRSTKIIYNISINVSSIPSK